MMMSAIAAVMLAAATPQQQVLAREALWIKSIATHDASTLATIDDGFVHTNYKGRVEGKAAMLARVGSQQSPFAEQTSDHSITFAGPVAIVHGLNSIVAGGHVIVRLRYTDIYVRRGSVWKAISAQETAVSP